LCNPVLAVKSRHLFLAELQSAYVLVKGQRMGGRMLAYLVNAKALLVFGRSTYFLVGSIITLLFGASSKFRLIYCFFSCKIMVFYSKSTYFENYTFLWNYKRWKLNMWYGWRCQCEVVHSTFFIPGVQLHPLGNLYKKMWPRSQP
jgi:hypothetical protein